jgi:hypothetical protein
MIAAKASAVRRHSAIVAFKVIAMAPKFLRPGRQPLRLFDFAKGVHAGIADCSERVLERAAVLAHGSEILRGMGCPGRPGEGNLRKQSTIGDDAAEGRVSGHPGGAAAMKRGD